MKAEAQTYHGELKSVNTAKTAVSPKDLQTFDDFNDATLFPEKSLFDSFFSYSNACFCDCHLMSGEILALCLLSIKS